MHTEMSLEEYITNFKWICKEHYGKSVDVRINPDPEPPKKNYDFVVDLLDHLLWVDREVPEHIRNLRLKNRARNREIITYRHCAFHILRIKGYTLKTIAKMFDINHATVLSGINNIRNLYTTNDPLAVRIFNRIQHEFNEKITPDPDAQSNPGNRNNA